MLVEKVTARLEATVPALADRVEGAAELALLIGQNEMPQVTPAAFVIPLGVDASPALDITVIHNQPMTELIGVVLAIDYAGDARGAKGLPDLSELVTQAVNSIAGWQPYEDSNVMELRRGRLVNAANGALVYQIDFSLLSYLRIT